MRKFREMCEMEDCFSQGQQPSLKRPKTQMTSSLSNTTTGGRVSRYDLPVFETNGIAGDVPFSANKLPDTSSQPRWAGKVVNFFAENQSLGPNSPGSMPQPQISGTVPNYGDFSGSPEMGIASASRQWSKPYFAADKESSCAQLFGNLKDNSMEMRNLFPDDSMSSNLRHLFHDNSNSIINPNRSESPGLDPDLNMFSNLGDAIVSPEDTCSQQSGDNFTEPDPEILEYLESNYNIPAVGIEAVPEFSALSQQSGSTQLRRWSDQVSNETPGRNHNLDQLKPVSEIPVRFRSVFNKFPFFNIVQSKVFNDVMFSDKSLAINAPTGSGKTVIFELAIIRLMMTSTSMRDEKIIYMAPIKALCSERFSDWKNKFGPLGLYSCELTGDSDSDDFQALQQAQLVFTTPEKWDSMTRRWRDHMFLARLVKILFIDEVHLLNDPSRGATIEAVVSRMKMTSHSRGLRLIAVSATVPNVEDVAEWLRVTGAPQPISFKMGEELRPVKLRQVVLGFYSQQNCTDFRFDMSLSYKLGKVVETYSERKPTLVFCSTRKGVSQTATVLAQSANVPLGPHKPRLVTVATSIRDFKLRELISVGVGFHHAGLDSNDRRLVEEVFRSGILPILVATGTLAMGVNMPAHLVVIKSTTQYCDGKCAEYPETQLLQMIGRAGRPQFDTSATAVIMTKMSLKTKYESLLGGTQVVESGLHKNLAEHLNAEIVLQTITDISLAMKWIRSTFLYIRVFKNPQHYGYPRNVDKDSIEKNLQELCVRELKSLASVGLIEMKEDGFALSPTPAGRLMANYCVSVDTMRKFARVKGTEELDTMLELISSCQELNDVQLRVTDKKTLNALNADKTKPIIRFPMKGKIKTREMKINCLIQAIFGCLTIQDPSLAQESVRIMRVGQRLARCLSEYLSCRDGFPAYLSALTLSQCFRAKLWENSQHVGRQIHGIGPALSAALVNAGIVTIEKLRCCQPRQLEMIVNRHPPFGNSVLMSVSSLPQYEVTVTGGGKLQENNAEVNIVVRQTFDPKRDKKQFANLAIILIGDSDDKLIFNRKLVYGDTREWTWTVRVTRAKRGDELRVNLVSDRYVGLDVSSIFAPSYSTKKQDVARTQKPNPRQQEGNELSPGGSHRTCNHRCADKRGCGHDCCKTGVVVPVKERATPTCGIGKFFNTVAESANTIPVVHSEYWSGGRPHVDNLSRFHFIRRQKIPEPSQPPLTQSANFNLELEFIDDEDDVIVLDENNEKDDVIVIEDDEDEDCQRMVEDILNMDSNLDWMRAVDDMLEDMALTQTQTPPQIVPGPGESPSRQLFQIHEDPWPEPCRPIAVKGYPGNTDFVPASTLYYNLQSPSRQPVGKEPADGFLFEEFSGDTCFNFLEP